jgi:adenylosuccinate synthase
MSVTVIVGAQWGDEGKGKLTHLLSQQHDIVLRYQGGANAGHTIQVGGETFRIRQVPSGILCEGMECYLCDGMVLNPVSLAEELSDLRERQALRGTLRISQHAHLVLPYHALQDQYFEEAKGEGAIGTTKRGIGPAYADKHFRVGLRARDMLRSDFGERVKLQAARKNVLFSGYYAKPPLDPDEVWAQVEPVVAGLAPLVADTVALIREAADSRKRILCEGAQGVLLDIDYGTYPFVTSSHPTVAGALLGTGLNWRDVSRVIGVSKAYCTRVGAGPFPTEEPGAVGEALRERGGEFGTVTGRSRRCGWLDLPLLRYAHQICGFTELALTKIDVLDDLEEIPVCVAYERKGKRVDWPDMDAEALGECAPVYERLRGWHTSTCDLRRHDDLPKELRDYINYVSRALGIPVGLISVGADYGATVVAA